MWKNIRKQYKNNKLKLTAPTCNDEFLLAVGSYSVSNIWDYIEYIIKRLETLTTTLLIHVNINSRTNNRLVFKIKDRYKRELQPPETIGSTKNLIDGTKNGEHVPTLEVVV